MLEIRTGGERYFRSVKLEENVELFEMLNNKMRNIKTRIEDFRYPLLFPAKQPVVNLDAPPYIKPEPVSCFI